MLGHHNEERGIERKGRAGNRGRTRLATLHVGNGKGGKEGKNKGSFPVLAMSKLGEKERETFWKSCDFNGYTPERELLHCHYEST